MIEYKEVWSRKISSIALAVFDNALNDHKLDSHKLISIPEHRPKQKDSLKIALASWLNLLLSLATQLSLQLKRK